MRPTKSTPLSTYSIMSAPDRTGFRRRAWQADDWPPAQPSVARRVPRRVSAGRRYRGVAAQRIPRLLLARLLAASAAVTGWCKGIASWRKVITASPGDRVIRPGAPTDLPKDQVKMR